MDNPTNLIFVEDNPQDLQLFNYALSQTDTSAKLLHYENGRVFLEALSDLYPANIACILIDLNMPFVNGFEVLEALKSNPDFQHIPAVVFTSTNSNEEKLRAYALGANAYVSKPLEISELVDIVKSICSFWIDVNLRVV